jgi:hypothetical protein
MTTNRILNDFSNLMLLSIILSGSFLHSKMIAHRRWKINLENVQFGGGMVWDLGQISYFSAKCHL